MSEQDKTGGNESNNNMTRRTTLILAAAVATFGAAMGMRAPTAWAQGKMEGKEEGKADGKMEGKGEGKEGRREGKPGHIKVEIDGDAASIDVKCAEDESMRTCADLTKEIIDKVTSISPK